ncbi:unnamed protein product [Pseudo-nitzschia multistriata]|uniref:Nuclear transport factor 2 n=1 Tax=Pseudo-nitzschia multistriata TaxID=183589 RepID=A0A448ZHJ1_9STRA|nr:unnamed protein product [Pseudo-nitzschia multistriata]
MSAEEVAKAFVGHYYQTFDSNVEGLRGLFNDKSMMTFEGNQLMGASPILEKLKSFGQTKHNAKTMDIQPAIDGASIVIFVTGSIEIGGPGNPLHFSEFFYLVSSGPGQYYVHNDIFRLNYGL